MIKCEVIENFTLENYNKLKNIKKVINRKDNEFGAGDTFECDEEMAKYLLGDNILKKVVVKVIEVEPKKIIEVVDGKEIKTNINELSTKDFEKGIIENLKPKKKKSKK